MSNTVFIVEIGFNWEPPLQAFRLFHAGEG